MPARPVCIPSPASEIPVIPLASSTAVNAAMRIPVFIGLFSLLRFFASAPSSLQDPIPYISFRFRHWRTSEDGWRFLHSSQVVSSEGSLGSHRLKYFPWIPISPFAYGYQSVPVSRSYRTKVFL